jgi:hypothetical protein
MQFPQQQSFSAFVLVVVVVAEIVSVAELIVPCLVGHRSAWIHCNPFL